MIILEEVGSKLTALRRERPLIHHITNFVTMDDCANATLAIGASPTMTNSVEEVAEMAGAAKALVLNLGTLQQWTLEPWSWPERRQQQTVCRSSSTPSAPAGRPFAPSCPAPGTGTAPFGNPRQRRGNHLPGQPSERPEPRCRQPRPSRRQRLGGGPCPKVGDDHRHYRRVDIISDGTRTATVHNGCPMLTYVSGTGCMTSVPHRLLCRRQRRLYGSRIRRHGHGYRRRTGHGKRRQCRARFLPRPFIRCLLQPQRSYVTTVWKGSDYR